MTAIVCVDKNWAIGRENRLLFRISADLKHFRALTTGKTVVMGKNTLLSLPGGRPLPNRRSSFGKRKAVGSSKAPITNMARPKSASVPPRLVTTFTRKLDKGSTAVRLSSTPASIRVKDGLDRSRARADCGLGPSASRARGLPR